MRSVLEKGFSFRFKAKGWSMDPFIRYGDVVTITPITNRPIKIGEVVAFIQPEKNILSVHRVIARRGIEFSIKGDNAIDKSDIRIPNKFILGRVSKVERNKHPVYLGLGPERLLITWLSRNGLLIPIIKTITGWRQKMIEEWI